MHQILLSSRTSFQLGDVNTGEPHLYCAGSLTNRRYLSRLERDPRDLHLRTAIAVQLPRMSRFHTRAPKAPCVVGRKAMSGLTAV